MRKKWKQINAAVLSMAMLFTSANCNVLAAPKAGQSNFEQLMEQSFKEPEMKHRPYARWWLAEGSHTDQTLKDSIKELYDAGFGGVEFVTLDESKYLDDEDYAWGSEEWIHDSKLIIEECHRLGMSVSMTGGTNWATANLVSITPDQEEASQELGYTTVSVAGSDDAKVKSSYKGELPQCRLPGDATKQTLVKVIAAKVAERGNTTKLDMDTMIDVTGYVTSSDGTYTIDFTAEDNSEYELFAFYQYGTSEAFKPAISNSYTINYLSTKGADALIKYWNDTVLTDDMQNLIDQFDECDMYMDSLELNTKGANSTGNLWCEDMLKQFSDRREYSIDTLLPLLITARSGGWGNVTSYKYEPADQADQTFVKNMRTDFFQTITELYTDNCLQVLKDWLHTRNMKLRAEPSYGKTFEISQPVKALDYVETESLEFGAELDSYKGMSGAAHLFDIRYSSETGAAIMSNYKLSNNYYRQIFYTQYAAGIQKTVTHGYSSEYGPDARVNWPGYEGMMDMFSERFNKRQPAFVDYPELYRHLSRIQKVLEQGVPQMDIAMLRTDYEFNNGHPGLASNVYSNRLHQHDAYYWKDMELQDKGYTYEYFSPYLLEDESITSSNGLLNADGVAYQALVVMQDELPYNAAVRMLEWAKDGMPILFVNNVAEDMTDTVVKQNTIAGSITGANDGKDKDLARVVAEMKKQKNVVTINSAADACETLQTMGIFPRAEYVEANDNLLSVMRSDENADYLYLYNYMYEENTSYTGQVSVDGIYEPYTLNTWNGDVEKQADYSYKNGRTVLNVDVAPGEVVIYVLDKQGEAGVTVMDTNNVYKTMYEDNKLVAAVNNTYNATVTLSDGSTASVKTDQIPADVELGKWNLVVKSYEPGEKISRTETNEKTGLTTTEYTYTTEYVDKNAGTLDRLIPWKDIESVGRYVSGVGTYTTKFTLPENWDKKENGLEFTADSFGGGTAAIFVNDVQVPVNMDRGTADLSDYVKAGENNISVRVTTTLLNRLSKTDDTTPIFGMCKGSEPDNYGMIGETDLISYKKVAVQTAAEKQEEAEKALAAAQKAAEEAKKEAQAAAAEVEKAYAEAVKAQEAAQAAEKAAAAEKEAAAKEAANAKAKAEAAEAALAKAETVSAEAQKALKEAQATLEKVQREAAKSAFKAEKVTIKRAIAVNKKQAKITWNKVEGAKGYQIQYSTKTNFKGKKTITVKSASATKKLIKKLKSGKKYYIRMRAYKIVDGQTLYTSYSAKKKVKIK